MRIRGATSGDLPRLLEIYNHYVVNTPVTFDVNPLSLELRTRWLEGFSEPGPHRLLVGDVNGRVAGYASSGTFRTKSAYAQSVETSIYLDPDDCGSGLGTALYARLLSDLAADDAVHRAYGGITMPNDASVVLHERQGFKRVGTFGEVGFKFGRYWDVAWFERAL